MLRKQDKLITKHKPHPYPEELEKNLCMTDECACI